MYAVTWGRFPVASRGHEWSRRKMNLVINFLIDQNVLSIGQTSDQAFTLQFDQHLNQNKSKVLKYLHGLLTFKKRLTLYFTWRSILKAI